MYSHLVRGGTSLYGHQVGFSVNIAAAPGRVVLDIVFDRETTAGALPEDVRFEMDRDGAIRLTRIPPEGREAVEKAVAIARMPCHEVLRWALLGIHV